jgi:peroxiredoxin Q/BCP
MRYHRRSTPETLGRTLALALALATGLGATTAHAQTPVRTPAQTPPLEIGAVAPDFELAGATRFGSLQQPMRLSDFQGKTVVLAFFPRARTAGCTIQMHAYRDQYAELFNAGREVVLIAISADPVDQLAAWARDAEFPFLMASDHETHVAKLYGALASRPGFTNRNLFVIGPDGRIAYRATPFREIDPTAYTELGDAIRKLLPEVAEEALDTGAPR